MSGSPSMRPIVSGLRFIDHSKTEAALLSRGAAQPATLSVMPTGRCILRTSRSPVEKILFFFS